MPLTSSQWIIDFATLTRTRLRRNVNLASVLGAAGLYAKPSKGRGHVKTRITAAHLTNFLLAQATDQASDAAEVVTNLRQMKYRGFEVPYFGDGNCGEIFDRMLEGLPGGPHNSPLAEPRYLPDVIHLSTRPYEAILIWRSDKAPGGFLRVNTYSQDWPEYSHLIIRKTFIDSELIEFARQFLNETETASTALPGAVLQVDQPKAHATDGSDSLAAPNLLRARVRPQRPPHGVTKS